MNHHKSKANFLPWFTLVHFSGSHAYSAKHVYGKTPINILEIQFLTSLNCFTFSNFPLPSSLPLQSGVEKEQRGRDSLGMSGPGYNLNKQMNKHRTALRVTVRYLSSSYDKIQGTLPTKQHTG